MYPSYWSPPSSKSTASPKSTAYHKVSLHQLTRVNWACLPHASQPFIAKPHSLTLPTPYICPHQLARVERAEAAAPRTLSLGDSAMKIIRVGMALFTTDTSLGST